MDGITSALLMTLIAGAATGIGGALVLFKKKISSNFLAGALGVSAGVMIFISLAELFPEAQADIMASGSLKFGKAYTLIAFFVGMGLITLIDFLIPEYENPHEASGLSLDAHTPAIGKLEKTESEKAMHKLGILSAIVIAIHNFPEGIATFIGALNDTQMGLGITFAISIHNLPEGIAVAIPIYYATKSKGKALLHATLSGMSEVLGALLCLAVSAIFGIDLTVMQQVTIILTATLASIGTAGVPGSGMIMLAMVLQSVGLPLEGIALVAGIDRILDMGRTVVNITGDAACAICVDAWEKKKEAKKNQ